MATFSTTLTRGLLLLLACLVVLASEANAQGPRADMVLKQSIRYRKTISNRNADYYVSRTDTPNNEVKMVRDTVRSQSHPEMRYVTMERTGCTPALSQRGYQACGWIRVGQRGSNPANRVYLCNSWDLASVPGDCTRAGAAVWGIARNGDSVQLQTSDYNTGNRMALAWVDSGTEKDEHRMVLTGTISGSNTWFQMTSCRGACDF